MPNHMINSQIELSIIIVNYQTKKFLVSCLTSIYRTCQGLNIEIIVIDNNSEDDSTKVIKESFPLVTLIENKINLGFAAASNQGLKLMKGSYALLLNPDTEVMNGTLLKMLEFMRGDQRVGILGCRITDRQGNTQVTGHPTPTPIREFSYDLFKLKLDKILPASMTLRYYDSMLKSSHQPFTVGWVSGACLMIRKEVIQDIGLLDENLFMYFEDLDWCYRANRKGWKVMYHPSVSIFHYAGGCSRTDISVISSRIEYEYESKLYFAHKHFGKTGIMIIKLGSLIELLGKIIITKLKLRSRISQQEIEMKLKGYMLALRLILGMSR
jgi:GT2 family glycosyltransferase